jgi:hypothetical protein
MSGTKFKRLSKKGAKNQYGTTEGGKVYYEYRMNRRDVDNKIRLAKGGYANQSVEEIWDNWSIEQKKHFLSDHHDENPEITNISKLATKTLNELKINFVGVYHSLQNHIFEGQYKTGGGVGIPNAEKMFHLPMEIAIYVPSTKDVSNSITASELRTRVKEVESYLAETFGGFTTSEKVGGYLSSKSSVIREKVVPVTAFATAESFTNNKSKLVNKMSVWAKKWGQEAIGFEFEGDLYYVPQKFKKGGKLTATYIPKRDIKMLTTVWGNNIRGKDLLDGAYTKRKNIKSEPKMARTMFEDEMFEYGEGGGVPNAKNIGIMESYREWVSDIRNQSYPRMSVSGAVKLASEYMLFRYSKTELIEAIKTDKNIDLLGMEKTWINALNRAKKPKYEDGGGVHTMPNGELMLDSAHYETGGLLKDPKDLYKLLNQAEINWQKDDGAEYKKIQMEIAKNNNLYYKQLNDAEKNYFQDKGAEYQRLIKMKSKFEKGGTTKPKEPTVVRGYFDDEPYEYAKGGMLDVEDFEALKKGDLISISYSSPISGYNQANLIVKSKTTVGKGKVYEAEKITFTNTANPTGVNFYAYNRVKQIHQKIGFAIGDLAIWNVKLN